MNFLNLIAKRKVTRLFFLMPSFALFCGVAPATSSISGLNSRQSLSSALTRFSPDPGSRQRRAEAYAKMMEGQRYLSRSGIASESGAATDQSVQAAEQAFKQAAELDPSLAEAHTALGEIDFYFTKDSKGAEDEALKALNLDRNNLGALRILSRVYTLKSGLREGKLDQHYVERALLQLKEITRLNSRDPEAWALIAELNEASGNNNEAIEAFKNWAASPSAIDGRFFALITGGKQLTPDAAEAHLASAYLQAGRANEAVNAITGAIALNPDNSEYLETLEQALGKTPGANQQVIGELQRLVSANPEVTGLAVLLAHEQSRAGKPGDAIATLKKSIAANASAKDARERLTLQAELAQTLASAMRNDEAIAVYQALLTERGIGDGPTTSGSDAQLATLALEQIINLQQQIGRPAEALATLARMRRVLGDNNPEVDRQSILILREQGKKEEALAEARKARSKHPDEPVFLHLEAAMLAETGKVEEGAALLRSRLKNTPEDYEEYLSLANLYLEAGHGPEAVTAAQEALKLAPGLNRPELVTQALLMLSSAQDRAGDAKGSEESLRRILATDPENAIALNNLGYFLVERNQRLPEALDMITRAVHSDPTNASYLDSLGWAYFKLGRKNEAEKYLSEAAQRNPLSATVQDHLGDILRSQGKVSQAQEAWRKALSLTTTPSDVARIRTKLDQQDAR